MDTAADPLTFSDIVRIFTVGASLIGIVLCLILALTRRETLLSEARIKWLNADMSRAAFFKVMAMFALLVIPLVAIGGGTFAVLEDTAKVSQCGSCHPMVLFVHDMQDPNSQNLAAQHYRNRWISDEQCYHCHADYGFQGTIRAKLGGVGHLLRYLSNSYEEPIELRHTFNNGNCLYCHGSTPKYQQQDMHHENADDIASNNMSCINCHDSPHPSKEQRTPGNPDYIRLMRTGEMS